MNIDATWLLLSLVVSAIGFVVFNYGRKLSRVPHAVAGGAMLVYPYFLHAWLPMVLVAVGILALLWIVTKLGW